MDIIDKIFSIMKARNITALELANNIGVSSGNVTEWKKRRNKPSAAALIKIAKFFDMSMDELLDDVELNKAQKKKPEEMSGEERDYYEKELRLIEILKKIPPDKREDFLAYLESSLKMQGLL